MKRSVAKKVGEEHILRFSDGQTNVSCLVPKVVILGGAEYSVDSWQLVFEKVCRTVFAHSCERVKSCLMDPNFLWLDRRSDFYKKAIQLSSFVYAEIAADSSLCYRRSCQLMTLFPEVDGNVIVNVSDKGYKTCRMRGPASDLVSKWERESKGKIGQYVRLAMNYVLTNHLLTKQELKELSTYEGTARSIDTYLKKCPLISDMQFTDSNGFIRCWQEPVLVDGRSVFVNKEWYEYARPKFNAWLFPVIKRAVALEGCDGDASLRIHEWEELSGGKIGKFAFAALTYVLQQQLLTRDEFLELCTAKGTLNVLGFSMTHSPLFGLCEIVDSNGYRRSWTQPVFVSGRKIFMNQQWYELHRPKFLSWLKEILNRKEIHSDMLPEEPSVREELSLLESLSCAEENTVVPNAGESLSKYGDEYEAKLEEWGKVEL